MNITEIFNSLESTKNKYDPLLKKLNKSSKFIFELPTFKSLTNAIESKEKECEPLYQNRKATNYVREKHCIKNHIVNIVQFIVCCLEEIFGYIFPRSSHTSVNVHHADGIIFCLTPMMC